MPHIEQDDNELYSDSNSADPKAVEPDPESPEAPEQETETPPTPIPIGMPVSPDEYKKLKKEAELPDDDVQQTSQDVVSEDAPENTPLDVPESPVEDQQIEKNDEQPDEEEGVEDTNGEDTSSTHIEIDEDEE